MGRCAPCGNRIFASAGSILKLQSSRNGARGYLHIKGGIQVEKDVR
ncbi:hypothetical protein [Ureibacillus acetophenoni]